MNHFILASQSPRRQELLAKMGIEFVVMPSDTSEILDKNVAIEAAIAKLSEEKAENIFAKCDSQAVVIAADTMVVCGSEVMGKPKDKPDAFRMLAMLSGRTHQVITAVTVLKADDSDTRVSVTDVTFRKLSDDEINAYIATGEPMDKAGAYGIQEKGAVLVSRIDGDFYGVMGLPVCLLKIMLDDLGITY